MFEVKALKKHFKKVRAVDGISFSFQKGDVMGFIGPNGAGKTTAMRVMCSLDMPTAGECTVDGKSIFEHPEYLFRKVGFMPDFTGTYPNMDVHEYVDFFARAAGLRGKERDRRVEKIEDFTGLDDIRDKQVEDLSKGMKQRLGLGRLLIHDPDYLILDEPAAGLDPRARIEVRELLRLLAQTSKGILVSSHILTELAEICNTVAIIDRGNILSTGSVDEIKRMLKSEIEIDLIFCKECDTEQLEKFLLTRPEAENSRISARTASFIFTGEEKDIPSFLHLLFDRGFPILEIKNRELSMEDIFMQVTDGSGSGNEEKKEEE